jgi:hypothetical protein
MILPTEALCLFPFFLSVRFYQLHSAILSALERGDSPDSPGRYFQAQAVQREFIIIHNCYFTIFPVNNREWFAPVSLPAEKPVAYFVVDF